MAIIQLTQPMTEQEERETQNSNNNYLNNYGIAISEKGMPGGVETLSSAGKLTHMPNAVNVGAVPITEKGANGGIPTLDANGKVVQPALSADTIGGIHILKGSSSGTVATNTAYGSIFYSADISVSFGMTLPNPPAIMTGLYTNGFGHVRIRSVSTTGFVFNLTNAVTSTSISYNLSWAAMW